MSISNNVDYLHGVIDTLAHIINQNTNININFNMMGLTANKQLIFDSENNDIGEIDTAKNYIQLLERARTNRESIFCKMEVNKYINYLQSSINETIEKLKSRKLDDKKINSLIKNNFLRPIECKLLLDYKYESITLNQDDISYLIESNNTRYNYNKYKVFNKEKFIESFMNYTISIFNIKDMIECIVKNEYCNIKYIPQKTSKLEDPFSFYSLTKIDDDKILWTMDNRILDLSNDLRFSCLNYCIELFRTIYSTIFHDNDYRENFERHKEILGLEGIQLISNINVLSNEIEFNKLFQSVLIQVNSDNFPDYDKFRYNLKGDDSSFKSDYHEINSDDIEITDNIIKLFDNSNQEIVEEIKNKIEII